MCPLTFVLGAAACGDSVGPDLEINVNPTTLEEAQATLTQIDSLQKFDPESPQALRALVQLRPRLDQLNGLVARIEPEPGHQISFYETRPGFITVAETGRSGGERLLRSDDVERQVAVSALYRRISGGAEPPQALLDAERREHVARAAGAPVEGSPSCASAPSFEEPELATGGLATTEQSLTGADGNWWVANVCFTGGNARDCLPNWGGGGWAQANAKTSFLEVAPYSGNWLSVKLRVGSTNGPTDYLFPGQWGSYWAHSSSFADCWCSPICACGTFDYNIMTHRWDIDDASGDGFHWTYAFRWTCEGVLNCNGKPAQ